MRLNWKSKVRIGQGGNATVYKISDYDGTHYAVKVSKATKKDKTYQRFSDEIKILENLRGTLGVVPILYKYLPEENITKSNRAYFVMPLCSKINENGTYRSSNYFYSIIIKLSQALVDLHDNNIAHRDIKPENLLLYNGNPVFSDFGLAHFPRKEKVSGVKEKIGAKWTIAPEMERISSVAEFKKADIYSFAKTLYILLTNQPNAFEGQYIPKSSISLDKFLKLKSHDSDKRYEETEYDSIVQLEKLLVQATDNDPAKRPDAFQFSEKLAKWYNSSFIERNKYEWEDCLSTIFPLSIPESSTWSRFDEIFSILELLSKEYYNLNYTFCPDSGGVDFVDVKRFLEPDCFLINNYYIVKPKRLRFESMNNSDYSYFQLELDYLKPLTDQKSMREYLYIDEKNRYFFEREGYATKPAIRYLRGSFVIARKTSVLNKLRGNLDGHLAIHKDRTPEKYKQLISEVLEFFQSKDIVL
jgi:serine/threonine protein kinase